MLKTIFIILCLFTPPVGWLILAFLWAADKW